MKTLVIQSFRTRSVPAWIERCLDSAKRWAALRGYDYLCTDDRAFALCGDDYLARVNGNLRAIANLFRLELVRQAHRDGYERAVWIDADIFVFAPETFSIDGVARYAFARESWIEIIGPGTPSACWRATAGTNNSVLVCRRDEPDLEFLIAATRHVALHREVRTNYQVGGDLIKGLRASLDFEMLGSSGMFSNYIVWRWRRRSRCCSRCRRDATERPSTPPICAPRLTTRRRSANARSAPRWIGWSARAAAS
jgi:hypothetical protein